MISARSGWVVGDRRGGARGTRVNVGSFLLEDDGGDGRQVDVEKTAEDFDVRAEGLLDDRIEAEVSRAAFEMAMDLSESLVPSAADSGVFLHNGSPWLVARVVDMSATEFVLATPFSGRCSDCARPCPVFCAGDSAPVQQSLLSTKVLSPSFHSSSSFISSLLLLGNVEASGLTASGDSNL